MRRISSSPRFSVGALLPVIYGALFFFGQMQAQVISGNRVQPASSPDAPHYSLSGTVINSVTGEPISRALVHIGQRAMLTNHEGHFQFDGLPANGAVFLQPVRKPGFFSEQELGKRQMIPLALGPDTAPVIIKLVPEAVIAGRIVDSNREPLEGVPVKLVSWRIQAGRKQKQQHPPTRTDEDGQFRLANLQPGSYYLIAGPTRSSNLAGFEPAASDSAYAAAYYPGVAEPSAAGEIRVVAGEHAQADMELKSAVAYSVSGVVTGYSMPPQLQFVNKSGERMVTAMRFDPATGKFDARVVAGSCLFKAHSQDARGNSLYAEMPLNVERGIAGIRLNLVANGIPVVVQTQKTKTESDGANAGGGMGTIGSSQFSRSYNGPIMNVPASVRLISTDAAHPDAGASPDGQDSNQLIVRGLENGRYRVEVMPFGSWYVQSVTYGTSDLLSEDLVVLPGETRPINVFLRDDFATLTGMVQGLSDPDKAEILIVPDRAPSDPKLTSALGHGEIGLGIFAPGEYQVFAFDSVDSLEYTNPEVLREYSSKAVHVTLRANQTSSVTVDLIRRAE